MGCVMNGSVVAGKAFLIDDFLTEKAGLRDVARRALFGQYSVRGGQTPRRVYAAITAYAVPCQPHHREHRKSHGQNEAPAAQRAGSLEILQVDSLRELLGCACSRHGQPLALIPYEQQHKCEPFRFVGARHAVPLRVTNNSGALLSGQMSNSIQYRSAITAWTAPSKINASERGICSNSQPCSHRCNRPCSDNCRSSSQILSRSSRVV